MRTIKDPEVRRSEILDAAERLFGAKGFEKATVIDILDAAGIAKGTFYYYFKSKEEVLDALIDKRVTEGVKKAEEIAASALPVMVKFISAVMAQKPQNKIQKEFNARLHETDNSKIHLKSLTQYILRLSPCLGKLVEEGNKSGLFSAQFPKESAEILLSAAIVLFDDDFFQWTKKETKAKIAAFLMAAERILGARPGTFSEFGRVFS